MAHQPKIIRARFVTGPFSSEQMADIAGGLSESIITRIRSGKNAEDQDSKPLKPGRNGRKGYPESKTARGLQPIRDWTWTGRTLRSLKVKSASENRAVIGFTDDRSDLVAHVNNRLDRMFGVSEQDREALGKAVVKALRRAPVIQFKRTA